MSFLSMKVSEEVSVPNFYFIDLLLFKLCQFFNFVNSGAEKRYV